MVNYNGLTSIELYEYLSKRGYKYDPRKGTFREFVSSLNIKSNMYNDSNRFMKSEVNLKLSKLKEK